MSTEEVKAALNDTKGDLDAALQRAGLQPRKRPSMSARLLSPIGAKSDGHKYQRLEEAPPPPVKIQRSGSNYFHTGPTYPGDSTYHAPHVWPCLGALVRPLRVQKDDAPLHTAPPSHLALAAAQRLHPESLRHPVHSASADGGHRHTDDVHAGDPAVCDGACRLARL